MALKPFWFKFFVVFVFFILVFSFFVFAVKPPKDDNNPPGKDKPDNPNKGKGKDKDNPPDDDPPDDNSSDANVSYSWLNRFFGGYANVYYLDPFGVWSIWSPVWCIGHFSDYTVLSVGVNCFQYPYFDSILVSDVVVSVDDVSYSWSDAVVLGFVDQFINIYSDSPHFPEPTGVLSPNLWYSSEVYVDCVFVYGGVL